MKTVIEMAREAGDDWDSTLSTDKEFLTRFAELVRADEREKYKWDVHSCGPTCTKVACVAMREAVKAEREACAKIAESKRHAPNFQLTSMPPQNGTAIDIANAIRERSNT
jgi:hypothetical protein